MTDLADLIARAAAQTPGVAQGAQSVGYRQGMIKSWNVLTGENTVTVAGVDLVNLPVLSQGYGPILSAGTPVAVAAVGSQMMILGRIAVPPTTSPFIKAFAAQHQNASGFTMPGSYTALVTASVTVPAWANSALVVACTTGSVNNNDTTGRSVFYYTEVVGGSSSAEAGKTVPSGQRGELSSPVASVQSVTPGGTIIAKSWVSNSGAWGSGVGNFINLDLTALFLAAGL